MSSITCFKCDSEFKRHEKNVIKCFICHERYHSKCAKISEEEVMVIANNDNINYFCKICKKVGLIEEVRELKNLIGNIAAKLQEQQDNINRTNEITHNLIENKLGKGNSKIMENKTSYSGVLARNKEVLLIKPIQEQDNEETRKDLKTNIIPSELAVGVENVKNTRKGGVIINCSNANSKDVIKNKVEEVMGDKYKVEEGELGKPKIVIVGVEEEYIQMEDEEIIKAVVDQNHKNLQDKIKVVKKYTKKNKRNSASVVLEIDPTIYTQLRDIGKINIGWRKCNIYDYFDIRRCFKCAGYNHTANKCTSKTACFKCGNEHKTTECDTEQVKCINCVRTTEKLNIILDPNHTAYDRNCPCYKRQVERQCNKINYPI